MEFLSCTQVTRSFRRGGKIQFCKLEEDVANYTLKKNVTLFPDPKEADSQMEAGEGPNPPTTTPHRVLGSLGQLLKLQRAQKSPAQLIKTQAGIDEGKR